MDKQPELVALAQNFIATIGLSLSIEITEREDSFLLALQGQDASMLTEQEGALLEAMQLLLGKVAESQLGLQKRLVIDCEGYRQSREDDLIDFARSVADEVRANHEAQEIGPYNSYERRLIHLALKDDAEITTESLGDGYSKTILIRLR